MKEFINKVFCGDNLNLLERMPDNFIDLIYCDILYGTGRDFGDYKDIKADREIVNEFYISRITEMRRVLKNIGSIYIQCDCRINHWIRLILDDIFGYDNFRNEIVWCYSKMMNAPSNFIKNHDNILLYSKTKKYIFTIQKEEIVSSLKRRLEKFIKNNKIYYGDIKNFSSQLTDNYINSTKNKLDRELDDDDIVIDFNNKDKRICDDVWYLPIIKGNAKERENYYSQKPKALLERIIKASSNKGDIVADFFCGSGTTLVVAKELGRKYIGCDDNEKAVEISKKRLNENKRR